MEMRKDYILNRKVIYAPGRKARPKEFKPIVAEIKEDKNCFFCPGNEAMTPNETQRIDEIDAKGNKTGRWSVRSFPNKFPVVGPKDEKEKLAKTEKYYSLQSVYGHHEVIVESNDHSKQLFDLTKEEYFNVVRIYKDRSAALLGQKGVKYVTLFKNHGSAGGTSIIHTHAQLVGYNKVPELVNDEIIAARKTFKPSAKTKKEKIECAYCEIAAKETVSPRFVYQNNTFTSFCPYASRYNYEVWIFPKKHIKSISALKEDQLKDLAEIMQLILGKLKELNCSYDFYFHTSPKSKSDGELHFHIEICPRIATWAGFELSTDEIINTMLPEDAANFYKGIEIKGTENTTPPTH